MTKVALLLTIVVALFVISGLIRFVLRRRRAARSMITTPPRPPHPPRPPRADGHAESTAETDAERRERLVEKALLTGAVPAVWYRHAKTALAAEAAEAERTRG